MFVVNKILSTLLLKFYYELVKGALIYSRVYCLICVKNIHSVFDEGSLV